MGSKAAMVIDEAFLQLPEGNNDADGALISVESNEDICIRELRNIEDGTVLSFSRPEWEAITAMVSAEYARMDAQKEVAAARAAAEQARMDAQQKLKDAKFGPHIIEPYPTMETR